MSGTRRVFPETFKREAVGRVATGGLSAGAVARRLHPARGCISPAEADPRAA